MLSGGVWRDSVTQASKSAVSSKMNPIVQYTGPGSPVKTSVHTVSSILLHAF